MRSTQKLHHALTPVLAALVASALLLGACDSSGPSTDSSRVEVGFGTSYSSSSTTSTAAKSSHDPLTIAGANDTLTITDVRLIVSEIGLEGDADSAEVEAGPFFLDLPLDTTEVAVLGANDVPPGSYDELEFEVEDVEVDDADDDEQALQDLYEAIQQDFSDWPEGASMVVVGTFNPDGGDATDFTAYFDAEIEVERELETPVEVTGDGIPRALTVELDPTRWFKNADGTVQDLSRFDVGATDELPEFEAEFEFEGGVSEIEVEGPESD